MYDSAKYLVHANVTASGVVERSDVVGAVFGQTEGLLGDDLDLRDLQESGKLGRIDVEVESERGSSFGEITIASGLDRVETAILAAALESIERVGPCRATVEIASIEDVRSAKRRDVVERAKELLAEFDETTLSSDELIEEVRRSVRVEDITEFHGFPAGPRVADSDAVVVVEGRSDVRTLLGYGVKNAIAVEGTNVPEPVAELTRNRTVTAFLDGDRGGDLILKELAQVGDIDFVALAPSDRSVEDLSRAEVMSALRDKVPFEAVSDDGDATSVAATDGSARPSPPDGVGDAVEPESGPSPGSTGREAKASGTEPHSGGESTRAAVDTEADPAPGQESDAGVQATVEATAAETAAAEPTAETDSEEETDHGVKTNGEAETGREAETAPNGERVAEASGAAEEEAETADSTTESGARDASEPVTLSDHVERVIGDRSGEVRLLDADYGVLADGPVDEAFDLVESADAVPSTVVLDGELSQRVLDVAAQRGVDQIVARGEGEFVKRPTNVRIRTDVDA